MNLSPAMEGNVNKLCNGVSILMAAYIVRLFDSHALFIGLFQRAKIHFSPPNSPVYPVKCATMPDKVIIIKQ